LSQFNVARQGLGFAQATPGGGIWCANSIVTDNGVLTANAGSAMLPFTPATNQMVDNFSLVQGGGSTQHSGPNADIDGRTSDVELHALGRRLGLQRVQAANADE
jgi:hypothetical protein